MSDDLQIITASGHNLAVGDTITWPRRLSRWSRFRLWIRKPWRWPPREDIGEYIVSAVADSNSFSIETEDNIDG
jgi:hypothetical protein